MKHPPQKRLHPRNLHNQAYDFATLTSAWPALSDFIVDIQGNPSIDYSSAAAVKALNTALLRCHYDIQGWDIPEGALCPPIPGRADYLHHLAEHIGQPAVAQGSHSTIRMLDIGTGANGIYALLAARIYGWGCTASDISHVALANVAKILEQNPRLQSQISLRLQPDKHKIFTGIIQRNEWYDLSVCNPPFHASAEAAEKANLRKRRNLGQEPSGTPLNFGGTGNELWCNGGERLFLKKMAKESREFSGQCCLFSSLVSNNDNLKPTEKLLKKLGASTVDTIEMTQGNKITRILIWQFQS